MKKNIHPILVVQSRLRMGMVECGAAAFRFGRFLFSYFPTSQGFILSPIAHGIEALLFGKLCKLDWESEFLSNFGLHPGVSRIHFLCGWWNLNLWNEFSLGFHFLSHISLLLFPSLLLLVRLAHPQCEPPNLVGLSVTLAFTILFNSFSSFMFCSMVV